LRHPRYDILAKLCSLSPKELYDLYISFHPSTQSDFIFKILENIHFSARIWDLVLSSIIKYNICGDKMVTRISKEFWYFTTRENGAVLGASVHGPVLLIGW